MSARQLGRVQVPMPQMGAMVRLLVDAGDGKAMRSVHIHVKPWLEVLGLVPEGSQMVLL